MKLSVIIVNYNVRYFLEQALLSAQKASAGLAVEIIVVDNNSVDGSVEMVREKFPDVLLIPNTANTGFAVANNQAIQVANGEYILLLNPDTVVEEDTFSQVITFMDNHQDAGGLGVKMYDGKGIFLPESKRGLPTPWVAFCKMTGLSSLFSHSKLFNYYYLGHLSPNETYPIDILSGAFMLLRKKVLDKIGLLDEAFFMYGEDIDLSYRIILAGYKNYYYPHTRIIHYKGESTKKGSLNYVRVFYNAMLIFARKHFGSRYAGMYIILIRIAIYFRALLAVISRITTQLAAPLLDACLIFVGLYYLKDFWQTHVKGVHYAYYAPEYIYINAPIYTAIWLISLFFAGSYDKPLRISPIIKGILFGTLLISAVYGFLPEALRFSRGMILAGMVWGIFMLSGWRIMRHFLQHRNFDMGTALKKRAIIVGNNTEMRRVYALLYQTSIQLDLLGYVQTNPQQDDPKPQDDLTNAAAPLSATAPKNIALIGHIEQLKEIVAVYRLNELIFCAKDISAQSILQYMIDIGTQCDYKIVPPESLSIIGSNSKHTAGDLYAIDIQMLISSAAGKRNKRLFDILTCLCLLPILPFLIIQSGRPLPLLHNLMRVLLGQLTWVGYAALPPLNTAANRPNHIPHKLPPLKCGVLSPLDQWSHVEFSAQTIYNLNLLYARDYTPQTDLNIVWQNLSKLNQKPADISP